MLERIYPEYMQSLFTNREKELRLLELIKEKVITGKPARISFFGLRRIGKTMILKESLKRCLKAKSGIKGAYLNLEEFTTSPEDFALNYVGRTCFWTLGGKQLETYLIPEKLLISVPEEIKDDVSNFLIMLRDEKVNRTNLLNFAFGFPSLLSIKLNIKIMMLLDEFQKILELKRFRGCKNVISLFRGKIEAKNVGYMIAGSAISIMHDMVSNNRSPLFNQFREESIEYFDKIASRELIRKLIRCDIKTKDVIYKLSNGHPFYINAIASRVNILNSLFEMKIDIELVKRAYVIEALSSKGDIYKHCEYIYDVSLERAKYGNSLKAVLKILTNKPGLNQSELARRLKITQGAVRTYLNELINVDLLVEKDNQYFFKDQILRYWLSYRELGTELSEKPREKVLYELVRDLEERYLRASSELGRAKEHEFKSRLEDKYGLKLSNYLSKDGQIELDLIGRKGRTTYIFEIKWRNKPSNYKDIKKFFEKVKSSEFKGKKRMFFAAKSFTDGARKYAGRSGVELIEEIAAI